MAINMAKYAAIKPRISCGESTESIEIENLLNVKIEIQKKALQKRILLQIYRGGTCGEQK